MLKLKIGFFHSIVDRKWKPQFQLCLETFKINVIIIEV